MYALQSSTRNSVISPSLLHENNIFSVVSLKTIILEQSRPNYLLELELARAVPKTHDLFVATLKLTASESSGRTR